MTTSYDTIIVVGGSAGAVLARRLSEDSARKVLLLEAGEAYRPNLFPRDLADADTVAGPDGHNWGYNAEVGLGDRTIWAPRGKTLGGSSAVNAAVAIRSRQADFAKWRATGVEGWDLARASRRLQGDREHDAWRRSLSGPERSFADPAAPPRRLDAELDRLQNDFECQSEQR